jgi:hypothetical protein
MSGHHVIVEFEGPVTVFGKREHIEGLADDIMDHLIACGTIDPDVSETYDRLDENVKLEISLTSPIDDPADAVSDAMSAVRSAFHAAEVGTPGWERVIAAMRSTVSSSSDGNFATAS